MNSRSTGSLESNSINKLSKNEVNHSQGATINNSTNQGNVAVVENNKDSNIQGGQASQHGRGSSVVQGNKGNHNGKVLPQTGEATATVTICLGIALVVISGVVVFNNKK